MNGGVFVTLYDENTLKLRYLNWLRMITTDEEFSQIKAFVIANSFTPIKRSKIDARFEDKIKMYAIDDSSFVEIQ